MTSKTDCLQFDEDQDEAQATETATDTATDIATDTATDTATETATDTATDTARFQRYSKELAKDKVLNYDALLEEILVNLKETDLKQCSKVSTHWQRVCSTIDGKKRAVCLQVCPFRIVKLEGLKKERLSCPIAALEWLNYARPLLSVSTDEVERQLLATINSLYAQPDLMILIEANNSKKGKNRRWKRAKVINAIRAKLPPTCKVIGIDAHNGLIGKVMKESLRSISGRDAPLVIAFDLMEVFGISCAFMPKFEGLKIDFFDRNMELELISDLEETKALVLISSGVGFTGDYLEFPSISELLLQFKGKLAVGGAQVNDKLTTFLINERFSDDTANYYFLNGHPPYNPMYNPQKMSLIGLRFSGPSVKAASLVVTMKSTAIVNDPEEELVIVREQIEAFKSKLAFDTDDNSPGIETLGFLFFNYNKFIGYASSSLNCNEPSPGISIFYDTFPGVKFIGLLTHAQYEHNFWPGHEAEEELDELPCSRPSTQSIASLVLINFTKQTTSPGSI